MNLKLVLVVGLTLVFLAVTADADIIYSGPNQDVVYEWACNTTAGEQILAGQTPVPEPTTLALFASGALATGWFARKRRRS